MKMALSAASVIVGVVILLIVIAVHSESILTAVGIIAGITFIAGGCVSCTIFKEMGN